MSKFYPPKTHTAYRESKVPKQGELLYDIDQDVLYVGDGVTAGGIPVMVNGGTGSLTGGFHIEVQGGTVSQKRFNSIETLLSGGTIYAGHSYKLNATSVSGTTIYAEDFDRGLTGLDATVEIMINGTGYLHVAGNLTIKGALEPDAMNNCVVRFHDGDAVLEVLDNIGGYIVTTASGSTAGTLVYALTNTGDDASPYITISSELDGTPLDLAGTTVTTERHVVGNGYEKTILGGTISIEGGTAGSLSFAALGLGNTTVASGTLTLGDVYIPSGATVSVNGGGLAIERVLGDGGVIDLGGKHIKNNGLASAFGCTFTGGIASGSGNELNGGFMFVSGGTFTASDCTFAGNSAAGGLGGVFYVNTNASATLTSCTVSGNLGANGGGFSNYGHVRLVGCEITGNTGTGLSNMNSASVADISSCTITGNSAKDLRAANGVTNLTDCTVGIVSCGASLTLAGTNTIGEVVSASLSGTVVISSGASINLTSSIIPGGNVTVLTGGCTVNGHAIAAGTYTKIDSTGTPT